MHEWPRNYGIPDDMRVAKGMWDCKLRRKPNKDKPVSASM